MTKTDEKLNSSNGNEADKDIGSVDQIKKKYRYAVNNVSDFNKHLDQRKRSCSFK